MLANDEDDRDVDDDQQAEDADNHGQQLRACIEALREQGQVDGQIVSDVAHELNAERHEQNEERREERREEREDRAPTPARPQTNRGPSGGDDHGHHDGGSHHGGHDR